MVDILLHVVFTNMHTPPHAHSTTCSSIHIHIPPHAHTLVIQGSEWVRALRALFWYWSQNRSAIHAQTRKGVSEVVVRRCPTFVVIVYGFSRMPCHQCVIVARRTIEWIYGIWLNTPYVIHAFSKLTTRVGQHSRHAFRMPFTKSNIKEHSIPHLAGIFLTAAHIVCFTLGCC